MSRCGGMSRARFTNVPTAAEISFGAWAVVFGPRRSHSTSFRLCSSSVASMSMLPVEVPAERYKKTPPKL